MELAAADALEGAALDTTEDLYFPITPPALRGPAACSRATGGPTSAAPSRSAGGTRPATSRTLASTRLAPNRDVRAAAAPFPAARGRADSTSWGAGPRPRRRRRPARAPADGTARARPALAAGGCALDATAEQLLRDAEVDLDCVHDLEPEDVAEVGLTIRRRRCRRAAAPPRRGAPPDVGLPCGTLANSYTAATCRARGGPRPGAPAPAEWLACAACTANPPPCWPVGTLLPKNQRACGQCRATSHRGGGTGGWWGFCVPWFKAGVLITFRRPTAIDPRTRARQDGVDR